METFKFWSLLWGRSSNLKISMLAFQCKPLCHAAETGESSKYVGRLLRVGISAGFESFCNTLLAREISEKLSGVLLFP